MEASQAAAAREWLERSPLNQATAQPREEHVDGAVPLPPRLSGQARPRKEPAMKKLIFALLISLAAALAAQPLAEAGVEKIVYDTCYVTFDGWDLRLWCGIAMAVPDGSNTVTVTSWESWDGEA